MKRKWSSIIVISILLVTTLGTAMLAAQKQKDEQLLSVREAVWRAWFAGDTKTLEELVPPETIVMSGGESQNHYPKIPRSTRYVRRKESKECEANETNQVESPRSCPLCCHPNQH
jgi:hypothetical protein